MKQAFAGYQTAKVKTGMSLSMDEDEVVGQTIQT
jgi:hypothetical protein